MERSGQNGIYRKKQTQSIKKPQQVNKLNSSKQCNQCLKLLNENEFEQHRSLCSNQKNKLGYQEIQESSRKQTEESKIELPRTSISQQEEQKIEILKSHNQANSLNQRLEIQQFDFESEEKIVCDKCKSEVLLYEFDDHMVAHEVQEKTPTNKGQREFINAILEQLHNVAQIKDPHRHNHRNRNNEEIEEFPEGFVPHRLAEDFAGGLRVILSPQLYQQNAPEDQYERLLQLDRDQFDRGKGLSEKQISKIKKQKIDKETAKRLGSCCICLSDFKGGDLCRNLICQHIFHIHCIDEWLSRKTCCPICKDRIQS